MIVNSKRERLRIENLDIVIYSTGKVKRYFITGNYEKGEDQSRIVERLNSYLNAEDATILSYLTFGNTQSTTQELLIKNSSCPVTWLQGDACNCDCFTSIQVTAVSGVNVQPVILDSKKVGSIYEDDYAQYCYLNCMTTDEISATRPEQALSAYNKMNSALKSVNMQFTDVIRMWNYLENLLEWYDDFNTMRTLFFKKHNVFNSIIPAGTGIGASNPAGTAYVGELVAVKPKGNNGIKLSALPSPMQCPAINYKSSFSRAIEIDTPQSCYISISGTASIEPGGETIHIDDCAGQIELTMKVISAILESRNMSWSNTAKAIAYFKNINDLPLFTKYLKENNYPEIPIALSHADICRDNLLFELELDAVK